MEAIQSAIHRAKVGDEALRRADAAILRRHAREVERAHVIVSSYTMWKPSRPALPRERLDAIRLTREYDCIARDAIVRIEYAILATDSYEEAARLIEAV